VDGVWATKSEGVELIVREIVVSKISNLCGPDPPTSQTQTDGRTTCDRNTALCTKVHRAVKSTPRRYNFGTLLQSIKCPLRILK